MKMPHVAIAAFLLASVSLISGVALAEEPITRTDLVKSDLHIPGYEAVQVRVDFAHGVTAAAHTHPGEEIAYVIEGTMVYRLEGREPVTLHAGQSLFIPSGVAHSAENAGDGTASELATYIVRKGETIYVPVK